LLITAIQMAVSGELMCIWYSTNIVQVKASLLFMKYSTRSGDLLVRSHKILIAAAFALVFLHMGKAVHVGALTGSRALT
jgi:quinol-cytochrome oxidoreductase complex cytochrome b subunit